jgi:hypothetical protein
VAMALLILWMVTRQVPLQPQHRTAPW